MAAQSVSEDEMKRSDVEKLGPRSVVQLAEPARKVTCSDRGRSSSVIFGSCSQFSVRECAYGWSLCGCAVWNDSSQAAV